MRIVIGISGASGAIMGHRLLAELRQHKNIESYVVVSEGAKRTLELETDVELDDIRELADHYYRNDDLGAVIASGSFITDGMIVIPCSMKTISGIAYGFDENLLIRAADVCLKEGRKVVLVPREMPLSTANIKSMLLARENGCTVLPAMLTFYNHADTLDAQIDHIIGKVLMQFGIETDRFCPWSGDPSAE